MNVEKYSDWLPLAGIPHRLTVLSLRDEADGLELLLIDTANEHILRLLFTDVVAYRCIDESYRLETWRTLETPTHPGLLEVEDSKWVAWLERESGGVLEEFDLTHYAIFTDDDCIDVVARSVPEASWRSR